MWISDFVTGVVKPVLDKFVVDADKRLEAENMLLKIVHASDMAQIEVNKAEAQHTNWFVAGWRPAIGWICGSGIGYQFVVRPFLHWGADLASLPVPPSLDLSTLMTLLTGMLGLSAMRSFEKDKGVARS